MNKELYDLYIKCIPSYTCNRRWFEELLKPQQAVVFTEYQDRNLIAFSFIWDNSISLLCVDPSHQNHGIGSRLLRKSEAYIEKNGGKRITLGKGTNYLLQGVPTNTNAVPFFKKRGYTAQWTSVNMELPLQDFHYEKLNIPALPSDISFCFADDTDKEALYSAVDDAETTWQGVFETCVDPVLLAVNTNTNQIVGFEILSLKGGRFIENAGCIGCVGVINSARGKGIGRRMVLKGIEWLKAQGSLCIELRYVELVNWYQALGFKVTGSQWMGEKDIT